MARIRNEKQILRARGKADKGSIESPEAGNVLKPEQAVIPAEAEEKSPEEKRREQIEKVVATEFDDFVKNDLDMKLQRWSTGKKIIPEEIAALREKFLQNRENIIVEIVMSDMSDLQKGLAEFDIESIKSKAHIQIWGKMLDYSRGKKETSMFAKDVFEKAGEDTTPVRAIAWHTIQQLDNFNQLKPDLDSGKKKEELNKEGNEQIKELARKLIKDFTVHGTIKDGALQPYSDLDGRTCLFLFEKAGFTVIKKDVEYVRQGETTKRGRGVVMDTSQKHGYVIEELGIILIIDHHDPEKSGRDSSATNFVYEGLRDFGLFDELDEKEKVALKSFVQFVTKEDNKDFTDEEIIKNYKNYTHNLAGLKRYLSEEELYKVFLIQTQKKGKDFDPYKALEEDFLKNELTYRDGSASLQYDAPKKKDSVKKKLEESIKMSEQGIKGLEKDSFVIDTGDSRFGRVLIDIGRDDKEGVPKNRVGMGYDAARANGFGAYIEWSPQNGYFAIKTANSMDFSLDQGANQRGHYWLKADGVESLITLRQILAGLTGDPNYQISPKLEAAIKKDREEREVVRKKERVDFKPTAEQEKWLNVLIEEASECKKDFIEFNTNNEFSEIDIADHVKVRTKRLYKEYLSGKYEFPADEKGSEAVIYYIIEKASENLKEK